MLLIKGELASGQQCGELNGHGIIIGIMHGSGGIPLSAVRLYEMDVISCMALDMYGCLHLIISYLLRDEIRDLNAKS